MIPLHSRVRLARVHTTHAPKVRALLGRTGIIRGYVGQPVDRYEVEIGGEVAWVRGRYLEPVFTLTPAESRVLHHIAAGMTNGQIAARLHRSEITIKSHAKSIYRKLGLTGGGQRVRAAVMYLYGVGAGYGVEIAAPREKPEQGGMWMEER